MEPGSDVITPNKTLFVAGGSKFNFNIGLRNKHELGQAPGFSCFGCGCIIFCLHGGDGALRRCDHIVTLMCNSLKYSINI